MTLKINDNGIDRNMTADEQAAHEAYAVIAQAEAQADADAQTAKQVARQTVLDKLGLTADEAQTLFG
jgi:hypothetical protein